MKSIFIFVAFVFASALLYSQAANTAPTGVTKGSVTGTVYCDNTHTVARFARVVLVPYKTDDKTQKVSFGFSGFTGSTDAYGNFSLPDVPEGEYLALTRQNGYISEQILWNQSTVDAADTSKRPGVPITVMAGRETRVTLTSHLGASLGGRVRYDDGGYAVGIALSLLRKNSQEKWEEYNLQSSLGRFGNRSGEVTDSLGRYYLSGLPEGEYQIVASLPDQVVLPQTTSVLTHPSIRGDLARSSSNPANSLKVYYGNTFHQKQAQTIKVSDVDHPEGLDIVINMKDLHSIRGVLPTLKGVTFTTCYADLTETGESLAARDFSIEKSGEFAIALVPAGEYDFAVDCMPEETSGKRRSRIRFKQHISLQADIDNLSFTTK